MQSRLASVVRGIDVRLCVDEVLHHSLNGQATRQYQGGRTVVGLRVQFSIAITEQDLVLHHTRRLL